MIGRGRDQATRLPKGFKERGWGGEGSPATVAFLELFEVENKNVSNLVRARKHATK